MDNATTTNTTCAIEFGPCIGKGNETVKPLPTKSQPAFCNDTSFSFYVPYRQNERNYTLHIDHKYKNGYKTGTHSGLSKEINSTNYSYGYKAKCGKNGFCSARFENATNPIVVPFEKDCNKGS
jgi:hypothetical protein